MPHTPPPRFRAFWGLLLYPTSVVEFLVSPLVKSLFCPINTSPKELFGHDPPPNPPALENHFLQLLREVGEVKK